MHPIGTVGRLPPTGGVVKAGDKAERQSMLMSPLLLPLVSLFLVDVMPVVIPHTLLMLAQVGAADRPLLMF